MIKHIFISYVWIHLDNSGNVSTMAEMKEAMNALGEFQELKSQVSLPEDKLGKLIILLFLVFSSFHNCG